MGGREGGKGGGGGGTWSEVARERGSGGGRSESDVLEFVSAKS